MITIGLKIVRLLRTVRRVVRMMVRTQMILPMLQVAWMWYLRGTTMAKNLLKKFYCWLKSNSLDLSRLGRMSEKRRRYLFQMNIQKMTWEEEEKKPQVRAKNMIPYRPQISLRERRQVIVTGVDWTYCTREQKTDMAWNRCLGLWRDFVKTTLRMRMTPNTNPIIIKGDEARSRILSSNWKVLFLNLSVSQKLIQPEERSSLSTLFMFWFLPRPVCPRK